MSADLVRAGEPGALAAAAPIETFQLLDNFSGGLVKPRQQQPALATISAGYREPGRGDRLGRPVVSRDGTIYVNGQENLQRAFDAVPGLAKALQATNRKRLTITFPFDDPALFFHQHFACYSSSALQLYGDQNGLYRIRTWLEKVTNPRTGEVRDETRSAHEFLAPDSEEFAQALGFCKVQTTLLFLLAEWRDNRPRVIFPDGLGVYRLRMTSRNSAHSIVNALRWIGRMTGGQLAGMPFDLFHTLQEVVGPDGRRRSLPIWQLVPRPPQQLELSSANFREVFSGALEQGRQLQVLPAPLPTALEAAREEPDVDLDEDEPELEPRAVKLPPGAAAAALRGGLCDADAARRMFFRLFGQTALGQQPARAAMLRAFTNNRVASLSERLEESTEQDVRELFTFAQRWLDRRELEAAAGADPAAASESPQPEASAGPVSTGSAELEKEPPAVRSAIAEPPARPVEPPPPVEPPDDDEPTEDLLDQGDPFDPEPPAENLDLLSHYTQRRDAIATAGDPLALANAWHDAERDGNRFDLGQMAMLREVYEKRLAQLGAASESSRRGGRR